MAHTPAVPPTEDERRAAIRASWKWPAAWQVAGKCRVGPRLEWYPESAYEQRRLTSVCQGCPVRKQCLKWALESGEHAGVWGGLTERELRKAASLTPAGIRRPRAGHNVSCPWCGSAEIATAGVERVLCTLCGFTWPGLVNAPGDVDAQEQEAV